MNEKEKLRRQLKAKIQKKEDETTGKKVIKATEKKLEEILAKEKENSKQELKEQKGTNRRSELEKNLNNLIMGEGNE